MTPTLIVNHDHGINPQTGNKKIDLAAKHYFSAKPLHSLNCEICKFVIELLHWIHNNLSEKEGIKD